MDAVGGSWAGTLACSECRRKRLTGESFSGKQLQKLREGKLAEDKLKCKECTLKAATEERERAAAKSSQAGSGGSGAEDKGEPLRCSVCKQRLPAASFTNTQARKPDTSRKCRDCSAAAEASEAETLRASRAAKMSEAQAASAAAANLPKGAAGAAARLKAASAECAREAEKVTGLKPLVGAGKRGGRGRGRGGTWRGRSGAAPRGRGGWTGGGRGDS